MRIFSFPCSVLAAFALGVKASEDVVDSYIVHISMDALMEIQQQMSDLKHSFQAVEIDPRRYYCESQWDFDVVNRVINAQDLAAKIVIFQKLCEVNGLFDTELFCFDN